MNSTTLVPDAADGGDVARRTELSAIGRLPVGAADVDPDELEYLAHAFDLVGATARISEAESYTRFGALTS